MKKTSSTVPGSGVSKVKLAIGAASLFLFIVGLKRSIRMDDAPGSASISDDVDGARPGAVRE